MTRDLPKVADVEKESEYGFVFAVSGPGKYFFLKVKKCSKYLMFFTNLKRE